MAKKIPTTHIGGTRNKKENLQIVKKAPKVMSVAEFNALSKAEQRVLIAKDVIAQLMAKKYKAAKGSYVKVIIPHNVEQNKDARENLHKIKNCTVCGIGSCLISATRFKNRLTIGNISNPIEQQHRYVNQKLLLEVFTPNQMAMIECAFEGHYSPSYWSTDEMSGDLTYKQKENVEIFASQYPKDRDRLIAIMDNLITNKGTFKP